MDAREVLVRCDLFSSLRGAALEELARRCVQFGLSGGEELCREHDPARALYIVVTGHLRAEFGAQRMTLDVGRFETIGGIGLLSGSGYVANVRAVRDSQILRIGASELLQFIRVHPAALLAITRKAVTRLMSLRGNRQRANARQHRSFAVIPANPGVDVDAAAHALTAALETLAPTQLINAARVDFDLSPDAAQTEIGASAANGSLIAYLDRIESQTSTGYLVYAANNRADVWSRRCMRQADRILVVTQAHDRPALTPMVDEVLGHRDATQVVLVIQRNAGAPPGDVAGWLARLETRTHYFVRPDKAQDYESLARQLTGRALGLVLGGGGARGFAHLGLLRALASLHIPVDLCGGSSMGAFISALHACRFAPEEALRLARETFVAHNYLNDYTWPRISLIRGHKLLAQLREVFGERRIEQLRSPFFCVTTNLTRGAAVAHTEGELALWVGASMAIPGIAPPVIWRGDLHVDGSVVNSLPTDIMQAYGRGPIIASDVSTSGTLAVPDVEGPDPAALLRHGASHDGISLFSILFATATLTSESGVRARAARADCYLRMPLEGVGIFDWKRMDDIVARSYDYAMEQLEPLHDVLTGQREGQPTGDHAVALF
ncbi:MAG TPA: cyclic nucleotide-binding and patatin-like phospholipase domain-containing protein [Nevskiaceae bacterium]